MKQIISLDSEIHTAPSPISPRFSSQVGASPSAAESCPLPTLVDVEFPLFEEATQTAARFLGIPISFVGVVTQEALVLKAAIGLSQLGLMNPLARTRRLPLHDSLVETVLMSRQSLVLPDITEESAYAQSYLVGEYGIRAYIGIPLLTADHECLGLLAAIDVRPHSFSAETIAFMELLARWSVSEYERHQLAIALANPTAAAPTPPQSPGSNGQLLDTVRLTLMSQLTQDMRNPLTTITGMASMLSREIYGTLTPKQREYADIVHTSSQYLLEIAKELLELSGLDARVQPLQAAPVDVDMVGQHVERMLLPLLEKKSQEIRFTVEPGARLWNLDREVVQYLLYHVLFSIVQLSGESGTMQVHSAERDNSLHISIKMTHPWLGDGIPNAVAELHQRLTKAEEETELLTRLLAKANGREVRVLDGEAGNSDFCPKTEILHARETLSLLLSRHLIERHGGNLSLEGTPERGYRFEITLPFLKMPTADS